MKLLVVIALLISHGFASRGFWRSVALGRMPRTADFAVLSFIIYYDFGLTLEAAGVEYVNAYFPSLFAARDKTLTAAFLYLVAGPWALLSGTKLTTPTEVLKIAPVTELSRRSHALFLTGALGLSAFLALSGISQLQEPQSLWQTRLETGIRFGAFIIFIYIPIHFVAFYSRQRNAHTLVGTAALGSLAILASLATVVVGQRTTVLLPIMIVALFRFRISKSRMIVGSIIALIAVSSLATRFKWYYADDSYSQQSIMVDTINSDFARGGVLTTALESSELVGSEVMPAPMTGYVYSALFFVPRTFAPFKGDSTARYFTAAVLNSDLPNWGFGLGAIEEIALNIGSIFVLPGLLLYGIAFGWLDRLAARVPSTTVPGRLAGVWLCGYHLPALVLLFGSMMLFVLLLDAVLRPRLVTLPDQRTSHHHRTAAFLRDGERGASTGLTRRSGCLDV